MLIDMYMGVNEGKFDDIVSVVIVVWDSEIGELFICDELID